MADLIRPHGTSKPRISRRGLLRGAAATGIVAATTAAVTLGSAPNALAAQAGWRWCKQCQQLWFAYSANRKCPSEPGTTREHTSAGSGNYTVKFSSEGGGGQTGWRWCQQCSSLVFKAPGETAFIGHCPGSGSGKHFVGSTDYRVEVHWSHDGSGGQEGWRHCRACLCLWFIGNTSWGFCEYMGDLGHLYETSGLYKLRFGRAA